MATFDDLMSATVVLGRPGLAGTGITAAEKTTIDTRLGALEAGHPLADHADTNPTGLADGHTWLWDAATSTWIVGDPSGAISQVRDATKTVTDVTDLVAHHGLRLDPAGGATGTAFFEPVWGGTGTAETVSRSDHIHNPPIISGPQTFAATGALSSGTRVLKTYNAGPLVSGVIYHLWARVVVTVRNDINNGEVDLGLRIGTNASFPRTVHRVRNVGGVDAQHEWVFAWNGHLGAGTTVPVVADITYGLGDPTNVRHGWVEFYAMPRS